VAGARLGDVEDAGDVRRQQPRERVGREVLELGAVLAAGVVDEDVDRPVRFRRVTSKASCAAPGISAAAAASFSGSRPLRTTDAPASASPRASASPMPCEEPVISARRPARSNRDAAISLGTG
jgi:hypothetical protein